MFNLKMLEIIRIMKLLQNCNNLVGLAQFVKLCGDLPIATDLRPMAVSPLWTGH